MPRLGASPGSALIPGWIVEAFYWSFHAPARALVRLGVSADALTYASLGLSLISLPLLATGRFGAGAAVLTVGAVLDALDGMVARARGSASPAGAVLDSFVDRISDAAPLVGLAIFYRGSAAALSVPLSAMVASSLVSYARAKADIYRLSLPNGVMRRHERVAILVAALLLGPLAPRTSVTGGLPCPVTLAGVAMIAAFGLVAGVLLVRRTRAALAGVTTAPAARAGAACVGAQRSRSPSAT
jgi:CDP-diacylglycerol--glycerol-3-phosphate 3-phosphatidyltransferase